MPPNSIVSPFGPFPSNPMWQPPNRTPGPAHVGPPVVPQEIPPPQGPMSRTVVAPAEDPQYRGPDMSQTPPGEMSFAADIHAMEQNIADLEKRLVSEKAALAFKKSQLQSHRKGSTGTTKATNPHAQFISNADATRRAQLK